MIKKYLQFLKESKKSDYFIPSYKECREICDAHNNFLFYETKHIVDGYDVSIFNYRLAQYSNFVEPIKGKNLKAHELRGLTFVWNKDGSLFKRYLLLDKFFNLDQTPCSAYSVVKEFKIKNIFNKEDGSIASFIRLPNGKIIAKSKASFESDQALSIQEIYDSNKSIQRFVSYCLDNSIDPVFEYVSPSNRIVVLYANTDLILLRLRDSNTGEYLDINDYSDHLDGISVAASEEGKTLDDLIELKDIIEDKEGWIIQFQNGKMIKIKSNWYFNLHGLFTDSINRENDLIEMILDETIDDVMSQLDDSRKEGISQIIDLVNKEMSIISFAVDDLLLDFNGNVKEFAIKNSKKKYFSIAIGEINGKNRIDMIKRVLKSQTKDLQAARKWVKEKME